MNKNRNKKIGSFSVVALLMFTLVLGFFSTIPTVSAATSDYTYYRTITINQSFVEENMTNHPWLVLYEDPGMYEKINDTTFNDIAFFASDNATQMPHDIEFITSGGGVVNYAIWVNITDTVRENADYTFYMYFGDVDAVDQRDMDATWGSNFSAVYHGNVSSGSLYDSSGNAHHASVNGTTPHYEQAGIIRNCIGYGGATYFSVANHTDFNMDAGEFTILAWAKTNDTTDHRGLIGKGTGAAGGIRYNIYSTLSVDSSGFRIDDDTTSKEADGAIAVNGSWKMTIGQRINDVTAGHDWIQLYINKTLDAQTDMDDYGSLTPAVARHLFIGNDYEGVAATYKGLMDELWIMKGVTVTNEWINTTYNSHTNASGMMSLGSVFEVGDAGNSAPTQTGENPSNGATGQEIAFTWNVTVNDVDGDLLNVTIQCVKAAAGGSTWNDHAANSSFQVSISGCDYSTKYFVYVNATDPAGSATWSNETYNFTTRDSSAPINSNPVPANGATLQPFNIDPFNITVNDPEGELMDVYLWTNSTGTWTNWKFAPAVSNGTNSFVGSHDPYFTDLDANTTYYWSANTTDSSGNWDNDTYYFTTNHSYTWTIDKTCNVSTVDAANATVGVVVNYTFKVTNTGTGEITDINMNETWFNCSCSDWNFTLVATDFDTSNWTYYNDSCYISLDLPNISADSNYTFYIQVNITECVLNTTGTITNTATVTGTYASPTNDSYSITWRVSTTYIRITAQRAGIDTLALWVKVISVISFVIIIILLFEIFKVLPKQKE